MAWLYGILWYSFLYLLKTAALASTSSMRMVDITIIYLHLGVFGWARYLEKGAKAVSTLSKEKFRRLSSERIGGQAMGSCKKTVSHRIEPFS